MMLDFDEELLRAEAPDDIKKMKTWMFQEQVRIQAKRDELQEINRELQDLKRKLERDKNALELREKMIEKRFDDNEVFIAKKKKIIEDAYQQLALDRKALECERMNFEHERNKYRRQKMSGSKSSHAQYESGHYENTSFFRGVDNDMALRKRYKELLKIFHPDNKCGDTKTLLLIQTEYESLKSRYYES
ncbi:MAG: hypothetical protein K2P39_14005 [Lachnospiraceae bacterium]|nr:hypothetical protein [Lachnospiraceae bacterium]MDE7031372.1 hypothetical protein [Lachnospiraceae bacterium]